MKVFLSWSGIQSRAVAEALFTWLPRVIQAVDPFLSGEIEKGARWSSEIDDALEGTRFGIICLTRQNLESPWLLYEAGALSKSKDALIWTLLLGLNPTDVQPPLARFQHTVANKADIRRLLHTINRQIAQVGERRLNEQALDEIFEVFWPQLDARLTAATDLEQVTSASPRSERELLEEVLEILRHQERQAPTTLTYRSIAYLAKFVEQALREKDPPFDAGLQSTLTSDLFGIHMRTNRLSDGAQFRVSVPVKTDWPQGSSWSYAVELAGQLKEKLRKAMLEKKQYTTATDNPGPQPEESAAPGS